jgi:SAM-dependent methyltransferase
MKTQAYNLKRWLLTGVLPRLSPSRQVRYLGWDMPDEVLDDAVKRQGDHPTKAIALDWLARDPSLPEKFTLLDAGCGLGVLAGMIGRHPALSSRVSYTGIDQSESGLNHCRATHKGNFEFHNINLQTDPLPGRYDVVTINEVIEHLPHYRDVIDAALALKPRVLALTTFGVIPGLRRDRLRWNKQHQCYMNSYSFDRMHEYLRSKTNLLWLADLGTQDFQRYWFPKKALLVFYLRLTEERVLWTQQGWTTQP